MKYTRSPQDQTVGHERRQQLRLVLLVRPETIPFASARDNDYYASRAGQSWVRLLASRIAAMSPSVRSFLFPALLTVLVLAVAILGSEVASRVLRRYVCDGRGPVFYIAQPDYGWIHNPGARLYTHCCIGRRYEFRALVEINSKGLRDREYGYERTPGLPRVLVLGDSVTEAAQVALDETFSKRVEAAFAATGKSVEIINAGVAGFGTDNELLFFRTEGRKYSPDVVLAVFNIQNDVAENSPTLHAVVQSGVGALPKADVTVDPSGHPVFDTQSFRDFAAEGERRRAATNESTDWLRANLYLYRWFERHLAAAGSAPVATAPTWAESVAVQAALAGVFLDPPTPEWEEAWRLTEALYGQLAADVRASEATLVVAIVPTREMVSPERWHAVMELSSIPNQAKRDPDYPRRRIEQLLRSEGVAFVDGTDALREASANRGRLGFYEVDPHPTSDGHRTIAAVLEPALRQVLVSRGLDTGSTAGAR